LDTLYKEDIVLTLIQFLARELEGNSLRELEAKIGVSHAAIQRLVKGSLQNYPELETLEKIAHAFGLPLWRVREMAGLDLGLTAKDHALVSCVASLVAHEPLFRQLYERMIDARTEELEAVLIYLEVCCFKLLPTWRDANNALRVQRP